jgi:hypothetical protein
VSTTELPWRLWASVEDSKNDLEYVKHKKMLHMMRVQPLKTSSAVTAVYDADVATATARSADGAGKLWDCICSAF